MDGRERPGKVYLVGAGPGDPGLITVKGRRCIEEADVVVYDRLASPRLLRYARPEAERIYVGKAEGRHTLTQGQINDLLVRLASEGRTVTRLKGGDPFVFGRGGEEAEVLAERGIPFEVVPGVTSAVAVPAYAGIPVTHRDHTPSFAVVTGHEDPEKEESGIDWSKLATAVGTVVFLMGVGRLAHISEQLMRYGRPPETPVALIRWGTCVEQEVLTGTLRDIAKEARRRNFRSPAVIVVGDVVRLRERLNWFERKPLFGRRILVTRARDQASELAERIEALGGEPYEFPAIEIGPPASWEPLDGALARLDEIRWIAVTSRNGVQALFARLASAGKDARSLAGIRVAAVGSSTAQALEERGIRADLVAPDFRGSALAEVLRRHLSPGDAVLWPRSNLASRDLPEALAAVGAKVIEAEAYRTSPGDRDAAEVKDLLRRGKIHAVTFTSSSTVRFFAEALGGEVSSLLAGVPVFCIGPVTEREARRAGIGVSGVAARSTISDLVDLLAERLGPAGPARNS